MQPYIFLMIANWLLLQCVREDDSGILAGGRPTATATVIVLVERCAITVQEDVRVEDVP